VHYNGVRVGCDKQEVASLAQTFLKLLKWET